MKNRILSLKSQGLSRDAIYREILGEIGAFGLLFGHKVCPKLRAKANKAWRIILSAFPSPGSTKL